MEDSQFLDEIIIQENLATQKYYHELAQVSSRVQISKKPKNQPMDMPILFS
jgi:hypothetical protein